MEAISHGRDSTQNIWRFGGGLLSVIEKCFRAGESVREGMRNVDRLVFLELDIFHPFLQYLSRKYARNWD